MIRIVLLTVILLSGCVSVNKLKSYMEIKSLSTSLLLIQLDFPQKQIDLLNEMGYKDKAKRLRKKHERHHIKLAKAFTNFRFCRFFFYYSDPEAGNAFNGTLRLYDEGLNLTKFRLTDEPFFVAKFNTKIFDDGLDYEELKEGLRIHNDDGSSLSFGFPDFIPMTNYGSERYYKSTIIVFNKRLNNYFEQSRRFLERRERRERKNEKKQSTSSN